MFPVASDLAGLQGLDPSLAVVDEIGFMPVACWNALVLASGKRPQSLVVGIGTPGIDHDNALGDGAPDGPRRPSPGGVRVH